jgi:hypothetical protein
MEGQVRKATPRDSRAVFAILTELASKVPVLLDTPERRMTVFEEVKFCCGHGNSWVSQDENGRVVGFLLGKELSVEVFKHEFVGLELTYGGVKITHQNQGRFKALLAQAKAEGIAVRAVVKHRNDSKMSDRLLREGFVRVVPSPLLERADETRSTGRRLTARSRSAN